MRNNFHRAFTLIEIVFVVAIIGIIIAIVLPQFNKIRDNQILNSTTSDIVSTLNKASSQTLSSLDSSSYGVHFVSDKVVLFKGIVFDINAITNENIILTSPATISNISLTGGATSLYFNRLTNTPNITGSITVTVSSLSKVISIDATGRISIN